MLDEFKPRERTEGDSYKPSEHIGSLLIVKVNEHKHIPSTEHKPEGGPGVVLDVYDMNLGQLFRDVLWMNGAVVDELRGWVGKTIVVKLVYAKAQKSGREYITVSPATPEELQRAQQRVAMGDPFAVQLTTTAPAAPAGDPWGGQRAAASDPRAEQAAFVAALDAKPPF